MCNKSPKRAQQMNKEKQAIAMFVAFCIEEYKAAKGLTGQETADLFTKYGVTDYLCDCYNPLHTQGREWLIAEIDEFIDIRKKKEE